MNASEKASQFAGLHIKGEPLILINAWDAGSAVTILSAGAKAIATSSWAVAAAQGYKDGEDIPLLLVEQIAGRIASAVDVPVSVDFEGGYSDDDRVLADNVSRLIDLGVVGINFEDRVVKGTGLYPTGRQAQRIAVIRTVATQKGVALFINARTDVFLGQRGDPTLLIDAALERAEAYKDAGASGFFIPGLVDDALIARIVGDVELPVNVMHMDGLPSKARLAEIGVARLSLGGASYAWTQQALRRIAQKTL